MWRLNLGQRVGEIAGVWYRLHRVLPRVFHAQGVHSIDRRDIIRA